MFTTALPPPLPVRPTAEAAEPDDAAWAHPGNPAERTT
jgi:hypothetical protein